MDQIDMSTNFPELDLKQHFCCAGVRSTVCPQTYLLTATIEIRNETALLYISPLSHTLLSSFTVNQVMKSLVGENKRKQLWAVKSSCRKSEREKDR